jgi:type I restriction enzyme S subunit
VKPSQKKLGDYFHNRKEKGEPGLPVLSVTMNSGLIKRSTLDRKMKNDLSPENSLLVEPGDIVYNMMRMWQGSVGVCHQRGIVSPAYVVCRPQKNIDPLFAFYLFKSKKMLHRLTSYSHGITNDRLRLYFNDFSAIPVKIPSLAEQYKISEILSNWDTAINQTRKLIELHKKRKNGLMQQLLLRKKRLTGFDSSWQMYTLGNLFKERKETNGIEFPLLAITGNRGIIPSSEIIRKDSSNKDKTRYKKILPGDIGYNTMRMWQGVSGVSSLEGIVSPAYTICIPKEIIDAHFIGYFFKFPPVINLFWRYSQGLVADTLNLKFHNFALIKITIPDIKEQKAIAEVLQTADKEINQLKRKLNTLETQKRGLMQKLLIGDTRVLI